MKIVKSAFRMNDLLDKDNHSAVRFLSDALKVFEEILFNHINDYIEPHFSDLLVDFWRNHTTQNCLIKILEKWKHLFEVLNMTLRFYSKVFKQKDVKRKYQS